MRDTSCEKSALSKTHIKTISLYAVHCQYQKSGTALSKVGIIACTSVLSQSQMILYLALMCERCKHSVAIFAENGSVQVLA